MSSSSPTCPTQDHSSSVTISSSSWSLHSSHPKHPARQPFHVKEAHWSNVVRQAEEERRMEAHREKTEKYNKLGRSKRKEAVKQLPVNLTSTLTSSTKHQPHTRSSPALLSPLVSHALTTQELAANGLDPQKLQTYADRATSKSVRLDDLYPFLDRKHRGGTIGHDLQGYAVDILHPSSSSSPNVVSEQGYVSGSQNAQAEHVFLLPQKQRFVEDAYFRRVQFEINRARSDCPLRKVPPPFMHGSIVCEPTPNNTQEEQAMHRKWTKEEKRKKDLEYHTANHFSLNSKPALEVAEVKNTQSKRPTPFSYQTNQSLNELPAASPYNDSYERLFHIKWNQQKEYELNKNYSPHSIKPRTQSIRDNETRGRTFNIITGNDLQYVQPSRTAQENRVLEQPNAIAKLNVAKWRENNQTYQQNNNNSTNQQFDASATSLF